MILSPPPPRPRPRRRGIMIIKAVFLLHGHKASTWTPPGKGMHGIWFSTSSGRRCVRKQSPELVWNLRPSGLLQYFELPQAKTSLILLHRCSSITKRNYSIVMNLLSYKWSILISIKYSPWDMVLITTSCLHSCSSLIVHHWQELFIFIRKDSKMPL